MASSSSSSRHWRYQVFPSFYGEDVRRTYLSHFLKELKSKGINTFIDHQIKRSHSIGPELVRAIGESRISIVMLSKNYASSRWCLDELLEILKCREKIGQTVMTIFYEVDPSDVRKQIGDFGKGFEETCVGKTEEEKQRWRSALIHVANIAGEHSHNWSNEADMIEKIATDVSNELNSTASMDFNGLVGIEVHIKNMNSLLCLESDEVRMVGIWGPAGIGKTTIARALYDRVSSNFQLSAFMENIKGSYRRNDLVDGYGLKLRLQEKFLSEIINQKDLKIRHLGVAQERLKDQKVLVILDDVDELEQLNAIAKQTRWFGRGSKIVVTTEDKQLLRAHGISHIYKVDLPFSNRALQILCHYAFGQNFPNDGFMELTVEVASLVGRLPLGLSVLGSYLRGMCKDEWIDALPRLRTSLDGKIEKVLRFGYDILNDKDKTLFLYIACLLTGEHVDCVRQVLANTDLDVNHGLRVLADKSLIHISGYNWIEMHYLLQQLGREIVRRQSINEPGKRQFLVNTEEIYDVLVDNTGTGTVLGISLDISKTKELFISERAFEGMHNLQVLIFYQSLSEEEEEEEVGLHLPEGLSYLPRKLRLLHWDAYPLKCMPSKFRPEFLVELTLQYSKLEKLWEGIQPLRNLKLMDLCWSLNLKEIPNLSEATNLEELYLNHCESLVMLPSSIQNLHKLWNLSMKECKKLEDLPPSINLGSLFSLDLDGCSRLRCFPEISENIYYLCLRNTAIAEVPSSIKHWSRLRVLYLLGCKNLKAFPCLPDTTEELVISGGIEQVPQRMESHSWFYKLAMSKCNKLKHITSSISLSDHVSGCTHSESCLVEISRAFYLPNKLRVLVLDGIDPDVLPRCLPDKACTSPVSVDLSYHDIERIPHCIKRLSQLHELYLTDCRKLVELPELPDSLSKLNANNCVSLERIAGSFPNATTRLKFVNCLKLGQEAQELIQQSHCRDAILPGEEVPAYFTHQASGCSLTIRLDQMPLSALLRFKACVVFDAKTTSSDVWSLNGLTVSCYFRGKRIRSFVVDEMLRAYSPHLVTNHLGIFAFSFLLDRGNDPDHELNVTRNDVLFEFSCFSYKIKGCGVHVLDACHTPER